MALHRGPDLGGIHEGLAREMHATHLRTVSSGAAQSIRRAER